MTTINLLPMATQDLLWQVTRNDAAKSDAQALLARLLTASG